jgi:ATP-dependent DNA helicase RecG
LTAPKFENDRGVFRATLYNRSVPAQNLDPEQAEILAFCRTPRSRSELAELFDGRITIAYAMEKLIKPMVDKGLLALTIPDKPKSKFQKYYSSN